jgi:4-diphosphocytidyl-2-C-methyl-D-erythritol kinase
MQALDLFDEVAIEAAPSTRVSFSWAPGLSGRVPKTPDLVEQAINLFCERTGNRTSFQSEVVKRIPIGAGLGGGSADAAAALFGLSEMHDRPLGSEDLFALAGEIGSDVPFGLQGGTAYAAGKGEKIRALPAPKRFWWVIGFPRFEVSTRNVYQRFDELGLIGSEVDLQSLKDALRNGDPAALGPLLMNDLEGAAFDLRPELEALKSKMLTAGALGAVMAGSGSAIAGLCRNEAHGREVAASIESEFERIEVVPSAVRGAEPIDGLDRVRPRGQRRPR